MYDRRQAKVHDRAEAMLEEGDVTASLAASRQIWRQNGAWARYYQAREGRVHSSRYCATLSNTTAVTFLWWLSGDTMETVAGMGVALCRRCFPDAPRKARKKKAHCPGSGSRCEGWRGGDRSDCPDCGASVLVTSTGLLRKHP